MVGIEKDTRLRGGSIRGVHIEGAPSPEHRQIRPHSIGEDRRRTREYVLEEESLDKVRIA